jgi:hypothetical protein
MDPDTHPSRRERSLLNKDAQVARGSQEERRVRVLVTAHVGDDERFTRLDGGQGVARPGCVHGDRSARHDLASSLGGPLNVPACAETATSGREVRETPGFAHV